jgi:hypothetical protein
MIVSDQQVNALICQNLAKSVIASHYFDDETGGLGVLAMA